jgi:hypothetical protein
MVISLIKTTHKFMTVIAVILIASNTAFAVISNFENPTIKIDAAKISYDSNYEISVLNHCKERGFIRPVNPIRKKCLYFDVLTNYQNGKCLPENVREIFLKVPIFTFHIIDLAHERYFHKIHFEKINKHIITETDLDSNGHPILLSQRSYSYNIPKCQVNMITNSNEPFLERSATPQETMVYTALYQKKISVIDLEKYSMRDVKDGNERIYSSDNGKATLFYKSPNCEDGHFINVDADQIFEDILAAYNYGGEGSGSGRYFGGEGSGSGLVKINLNLPKHEFKSLRFKVTPYERMMNIKPRYYKYLVNGEKIPDSIAKINCSLGGENGK